MQIKWRQITNQIAREKRCSWTAEWKFIERLTAETKRGRTYEVYKNWQQKSHWTVHASKPNKQRAALENMIFKEASDLQHKNWSNKYWVPSLCTFHKTTSWNLTNLFFYSSFFFLVKHFSCFTSFEMVFVFSANRSIKNIFDWLQNNFFLIISQGSAGKS